MRTASALVPHWRAVVIRQRAFTPGRSTDHRGSASASLHASDRQGRNSTLHELLVSKIIEIKSNLGNGGRLELLEQIVGLFHTSATQGVRSTEFACVGNSNVICDGNDQRC